MTRPEAAGQRFLAVAGDFLSMTRMAQVLREGLGERAAKVPTRRVPSWLVRVVALFDPGVRQTVSEIGVRRSASSAKARELLGWNPRPPEEGIVATAESLLELRG